jgi:hypothetical protein
LRIALASIQQSVIPLQAAAYAYRNSVPRNLDGLERLLLEHLADVESCLAHVRLMRGVNKPAGCVCNPVGTDPWPDCPVHGSAVA